MAVDPDLIVLCTCCAWSPAFSAYRHPRYSIPAGSQCYRSAVCEFNKAKYRALTDAEKAMVLLGGLRALEGMGPRWTR